MPRARRRRERGRTRRASGAPGRCANSSTGLCIGARSSTAGPRSATSRARSSRRSARRRNGSASRRRNCGSSRPNSRMPSRRAWRRCGRARYSGANGPLRGRPAGEGSPYVLVGLRAVRRLRRLDGGRVVEVRRAPDLRVPLLSVATAGRDCVREQASAPDDRRRRGGHRRGREDADEPEGRRSGARARRGGDTPRRDGAEARRARGQARRGGSGGRTRLTTAIKRGGDLDPLLDAIRESEARRADLRQQIAVLDSAPRSPKLDVDAVRAKLRSYIADYRKLLRGHVPQTQQILRRLIVGKLTFIPKLNGDYEFVGRGTVRPLLAGVVQKLASPTGFEPVF